MAKYRPHIVFVLLMIAYIITRFVRAKYEVNEFVAFHLTDLLFIPAMACFALIFTRILKRDSTITISPWVVLIITILVAGYFEWYLPKYGPKHQIHVADIIDIAMYAIGMVAFLIVQYFFFRVKTATRRATRR